MFCVSKDTIKKLKGQPTEWGAVRNHLIEELEIKIRLEECVLKKNVLVVPGGRFLYVGPVTGSAVMLQNTPERSCVVMVFYKLEFVYMN